MITFEYNGFDERGRSVRGLLEALDAKDARKKLAARGVLAEDVREAGKAASQSLARKSAFDVLARTMFYRELAALLDAGLALVPALEVILESPELGSVQRVLAGIRDAVREGKPLSTAFANAVPDLTSFEEAVLEVGEHSGGMGEAMARLADFLEEQERLRAKLVSTLAYPCVVAALAVVIGGLVLTFMLPMVQSLFAEANLKVGAFTATVVFAGRLFGVLLLLCTVGGGLGWMWLRRKMRIDPALRVQVDQTLFRLPLVGVGRQALASLRFVRVLCLLLERGVGLLEAVPLAGRASGSAWVCAETEQEMEALRHGVPLAGVVRNIHALHPSLGAWVQAGEASGDLVRLLESAGNRFQQTWERLASRSVMVMEIGMTVVVGGCVALIAVSVLLPILQVNQGILP